ncbi:MAG: V-type ATP synthase subunit D [Spirochaetota bacterium]
MARNVAPTRTNLLRMREELEFAQLGHQLLDQKRNILVVELLNLVDQAVDFQRRAEEALHGAFRSLEEAVLAMGKRRLRCLACGVHAEVSITLKTRRVMGVTLPVVETGFPDTGPQYGLMDTSFWADSAQAEFRKVLQIMGRLAELKVSVLRLAREVKRTIRKVNALEKIAIPDLRETVAFVQGAIEEYEREMFTLMKMVKERLERRRQPQAGREGGESQ